MSDSTNLAVSNHLSDNLINVSESVVDSPQPPFPHDLVANFNCRKQCCQDLMAFIRTIYGQHFTNEPNSNKQLYEKQTSSSPTDPQPSTSSAQQIPQITAHEQEVVLPREPTSEAQSSTQAADPTIVETIEEDSSSTTTSEWVAAVAIRHGKRKQTKQQDANKRKKPANPDFRDEQAIIMYNIEESPSEST